MGRIRSFLLLFLLMFSTAGFSQNLVVVQNIWDNDLNSYNPKEYFDKLFSIFKDKLGAKDVGQNLLNLSEAQTEEQVHRQIQDQIKAKKLPPESAYFLSVATQLKLPTINLGKFLFKNPPRSSKYIMAFHLYDGSGTEVLADTVINRGCIVTTINDKGDRYFYSDYNNFMDDMQCHLNVLKKIVDEKVLPKKKVERKG